MLVIFFFLFKEEEGIRVSHWGLDSSRVCFRSPVVNDVEDVRREDPGFDQQFVFQFNLKSPEGKVLFVVFVEVGISYSGVSPKKTQISPRCSAVGKLARLDSLGIGSPEAMPVHLPPSPYVQ